MPNIFLTAINKKTEDHESPRSILISEGTAQVMKPRCYTAGFEIIWESFGILRENESLFLCSDGVTQAGMGAKYVFGIGASGIADYLQHALTEYAHRQQKLDKILALTKKSPAVMQLTIPRFC
ncbi:MAG: hypothetical protein LLG09_00795 [Negativicutes bacterium]|nr:hypothetical protein [Negativicutes bacterium]